MLVRNLPLSNPEEYDTEVEKGIEKELSAAINKYHPTSFNWDMLLHHCYQRRLQSKPMFHQDYPYDRETFQRISYGFHRSKGIFEKMLFYPIMGSKTIGNNAHNTSSRYHHLVQDMDMDEDKTTTSDLELSISSYTLSGTHSNCALPVYSRSGIQPCGVTEVRWALKYSDLKPRVYYARGPDHYYASRYIQQVFNVLVDTLESTHRRNRYLSESIRMTSSMTLFIYDYSSFTSTFHEVNNFLFALGRYYRGTMIQVFDTFEGFKSIDLGQYLTDYVHICNDRSAFDIGAATLDHSYSGPCIHYHNTGMLGVPGNISSCTLAHGIHLSIILQSVFMSRCVGDDAIGATSDHFDDHVFPLIQNIGLVERMKAETWNQDDDDMDGDNPEKKWNYVKRPIQRIGGRVVQERMVSFPPAGLILQFKDDHHTTSFETEFGSREHLKKVTRMCTSLVIAYDPLLYPENDEDEDILRSFITIIRRTFERYFHKKRKMEKNKEYLREFFRDMKLLETCRRGGPGWFEDWWYSLDQDFIVLPIPFEHTTLDPSDVSLSFDIPYLVDSNPLWGCLRRLGYCTRTPVEGCFPVCEETKELARRFFLSEYRGCFTVILDSRIPSHILDSIHAVLLTDHIEHDELDPVDEDLDV